MVKIGSTVFWLFFRWDIRIFWISMQYHTAQSHSPRSMKLRWVNLPAVSYTVESHVTFPDPSLKGYSNKITSSLFHSNLPGPLTNGFKYVRFWLRFRRAIQIFLKISAQYVTELSQSPRSIILRRVSLRAVSYCGESLHNCGSQQPFLNTFAQEKCRENDCKFLFYY